MIILYTTHCPVCKGVEAILNKKKVHWKEIEGEEAIKKLGFSSAPVLEVDGEYFVGGAIYKKLNTIEEAPTMHCEECELKR